jgi:hypothetical protein
MEEKLAKTIDKEMNSKISSRSRTTKDVTSIVKKELAIFEVEGKRGVTFESSYENFNSIPPSSVEPERVFSGCGRTFESMDMLTFLRGYIKTENN